MGLPCSPLKRGSKHSAFSSSFLARWKFLILVVSFLAVHFFPMLNNAFVGKKSILNIWSNFFDNSKSAQRMHKLILHKTQDYVTLMVYSFGKSTNMWYFQNISVIFFNILSNLPNIILCFRLEPTLPLPPTSLSSMARVIFLIFWVKSVVCFEPSMARVIFLIF